MLQNIRRDMNVTRILKRSCVVICPVMCTGTLNRSYILSNLNNEIIYPFNKSYSFLSSIIVDLFQMGTMLGNLAELGFKIFKEVES